MKRTYHFCRPRRRWEGNIKIEQKETGQEVSPHRLLRDRRGQGFMVNRN